MNALQKVAWTELIVSILALTSVLILYPWFGDRATAGFGLLGLLGLAPLFMIRRGDKILSDERDQDIELRSKFYGFGTAWVFLFLSLIAIAMWHSYHELDVPTKYVFAVVWMQFVVCYGVKGAVALHFYRGSRRAA